MQLNDTDIAVIGALVTHFYDVVPRELQTYCALTSRISQTVLSHFGIQATLQPCQVWLVTDERNFVVGFVGRPNPRKWDGHVVCRAGNMIIDAALMHFTKQFGLQTPGIVASTCFDVPSQVISRRDLGVGSRLWWHHPPVLPGIDTRVL